MRQTAIVILLSLLFFSGCETVNKSAVKEEPPKSKYDAVNQAFYGFPDVPVPKELKLDNNRSFVYETQTIKVGVLALSGNVETDSLENYFKINMIKNGWRFVNSFRFKDVILNFVKDDKTCNIKMSREIFTTDVEIWVGPSEKVTTQKSYEPGK